jgi:hypothetical protein
MAKRVKGSQELRPDSKRLSVIELRAELEELRFEWDVMIAAVDGKHRYHYLTSGQRGWSVLYDKIRQLEARNSDLQDRVGRLKMEARYYDDLFHSQAPMVEVEKEGVKLKVRQMNIKTVRQYWRKLRQAEWQAARLKLILEHYQKNVTIGPESTGLERQALGAEFTDD